MTDSLTSVTLRRTLYRGGHVNSPEQTGPHRQQNSAVTTILEPPEEMRPMEIPLEDRGDAIVLTGLYLRVRTATD